MKCGCYADAGNSVSASVFRVKEQRGALVSEAKWNSVSYAFAQYRRLYARRLFRFAQLAAYSEMLGFVGAVNSV